MDINIQNFLDNLAYRIYDNYLYELMEDHPELTPEEVAKEFYEDLLGNLKAMREEEEEDE